MSGGPGTGMGIAVTTVTTDAQAPNLDCFLGLGVFFGS